MEVHSSHKPSKDFVAHKLLDVLLEHTKYTLFQVMLFMSDEAQNKLVDEIATTKNRIQAARIKDKPNSEKENNK